jgi:16S rRNA (guanine527-N7)-methyltransferase
MKNELKKLSLSFDDVFYKRCDTYIGLLQQWGKVHNFTSFRGLQKEEIEKNIIDSVYPLTFLKEFETFADIGTGSGYPGMILAMARPDIKCTLIEPRIKRVAFLNFVKSALELKNVEVIAKRAEEVENCTFDLITSRAVTNTTLLLDITKKLTSKNTEYLFYKGSLYEGEVKEAKLNNYEVISVGEHRNFLYIKHEASTV